MKGLIVMHEKMLWFNDDIQYRFHDHIVEYDMKAASVSVCECFHLLDDETIKLMKLMPKEKRTVEMGNLQKNTEFSNKLLSGIREIRKKFLETNGLDESNVISLHSDACLISSSKRLITNIDGVEFRKKGTWTGYIKYQNIEILYVDGTLTIKGMPKQTANYHTLGLNQHILKIFEMIENYDLNIYKYLSRFQRDYIQDKLPEYYYPSFGLRGEYKTNNFKLLSLLANIVINETRRW